MKLCNAINNIMYMLLSSSWCFSSFAYPGLDFLKAIQRVFIKKKKQRTLTLSVHLVPAPSFFGEVFCFCFLYVFFWIYHIICCVCLFACLIFILAYSLDFCSNLGSHYNSLKSFFYGQERFCSHKTFLLVQIMYLKTRSHSKIANTFAYL